jgi:DNA end-binding protein Ku
MASEPTGGRKSARRPLFQATIAFGRVQIPVALHPAVRKRAARFHDVHDADGGRIQHRAVCAKDGATVPHEHIVKAFDLPDGRRVQVSPRELTALAPDASRRIAIDAFVDPAEVDPLLIDQRYHLAPQRGAARAYALLRDAMAALHRVAVAQVVLRGRQHLALIRPAGPARRPAASLILVLLDHADEILPAEDLPEGVVTTERERLLAERLVEAQAARFVPERYRDEHRERVLAFLREKAEGAAAVLPPPAPAVPEVEEDLTAALTQSLTDAERRAA